VRPDRTSVYAQYTILAEHRETLRAALEAKGIPTAVHYPVPLHRQPAYEHLSWPELAPVSARLASQVVSLPMHAVLSREDQDRVVVAVASALSITPRRCS
jgi:UDP-2-acetamido-2-deoxy-ribo-hexuluronate aminotransferase